MTRNNVSTAPRRQWCTCRSAEAATCGTHTQCRPPIQRHRHRAIHTAQRKVRLVSGDILQAEKERITWQHNIAPTSAGTSRINSGMCASKRSHAGALCWRTCHVLQRNRIVHTVSQGIGLHFPTERGEGVGRVHRPAQYLSRCHTVTVHDIRIRMGCVSNHLAQSVSQGLSVSLVIK